MLEYELDYNLNEAIERQKISRSDITRLRKEKGPNVPTTITDKQLALFLNACPDFETAKKVLQIHYDARKDGPEIFNDRDPLTDSVQQCLNNQMYFHLPPTPDGYQLIYHRLQNSKITNYNMGPSIKTFLMMIDTCLNETGPQNGIIFLYDMQHMSLTHLTRTRFGVLRKYIHYVQDALPSNLKAIHVFNTSTFFDKVLMLLKPIVKAELLALIQTHPPNVNYDEFAEKYVAKSSLPSDYGGNLPSVEVLHEQYRTKLENKRRYFYAEEVQRQKDGQIGKLEIIEEMTKLQL